MFASQPSAPAPAILGSSVVIKGEIQSGAPLLIEGEVEGSIAVLGHQLIIAANGRVRASVIASEIEVHGWFDGHGDSRIRN